MTILAPLPDGFAKSAINTEDLAPIDVLKIGTGVFIVLDVPDMTGSRLVSALQ